MTASRRKLPARGWQGDSRCTEQPAPSAVSPDGWSAGEGPLLHSHLFGQTIKHLHTALTRAAPRHIPSLAQGLGLSLGRSRAGGRAGP